MIRNLVKSRNFVVNFALSKRTYLSEAFKCTESWNQRLSTPILQKISDENLYYELDAKYQQQKLISAIDVDLYANKITDDTHVDEIADLLQKMRLTSEATKILESTGHAVIRNYVEHNQIEALINVLNHRSEYGIFLDYYSANLVLDKLIEEKNFKAAARISTIFMLQEEFENPITNYLSLYACYKFLPNLETFDDLVVVEEPQIEEGGGGKKKKKEEIRIRVSFLRNPYHDDHFDIIDTNHLVGKAFLYFSEEIQDPVLSNNLKLLGLGLYEKYDEANQFLDTHKGPFYKETVEFLKGFADKVEKLDEKENGKLFFDKCASLESLQDGNVEEIIEKCLKDAVAAREIQDIDEQKKIYTSWIQVREQRLSEELARLDRIKRLKKVEELQKEMEEKERKLWYFDNVDKIDLEIESKKVFYPKRWFGKKKKPRVVDENYVPPDVDRRRNQKI